jgi:hypothetical protein
MTPDIAMPFEQQYELAKLAIPLDEAIAQVEEMKIVPQSSEADFKSDEIELPNIHTISLNSIPRLLQPQSPTLNLFDSELGAPSDSKLPEEIYVLEKNMDDCLIAIMEVKVQNKNFNQCLDLITAQIKEWIHRLENHANPQELDFNKINEEFNKYHNAVLEFISFTRDHLSGALFNMTDALRQAIQENKPQNILKTIAEKYEVFYKKNADNIESTVTVRGKSIHGNDLERLQSCINKLYTETSTLDALPAPLIPTTLVRKAF